MLRCAKRDPNGDRERAEIKRRKLEGKAKAKRKRKESCLSNDIVLRNIDVWRWLGALGNAVVLHAANNTHQRLE